MENHEITWNLIENTISIMKEDGTIMESLEYRVKKVKKIKII